MLPHLKTILQTNLLCLSQRYRPPLPTLTLSLKSGSTSKRSSALFKDSYLKVLFNNLNDTGIGVAKKSKK